MYGLSPPPMMAPGMAPGMPPPRPMQPQNMRFKGPLVIILSFIMLILGILVLVAQIGLFFQCAWNAVCLVVPTFVAVILFIIGSIVGIAAGVRRTDGMILTLLVLSVITIIVTPVNMGMWALKPTEGGIPIPFSLTTGSSTLIAIYFGLLFIPIIHWILFIVLAALCADAICFNGGPRAYGGGMGYPNKGYNPNPIYGQGPRFYR